MDLGGFLVNDSGDCLRLMVAFSEEGVGEAYEATYSLSRAIVMAATASDEPAVCHTKLQWWREEILQMLNGTPRHPESEAFVERVGIDAETEQYVNEWLVAATRVLEGPEPVDRQTHRVAAFRRYGPLLALPMTPEQRAADRGTIRDTAIALYALDAVAKDRTDAVFEYDEVQALNETLLERAPASSTASLAVIAATAASAMRRRHDGLKPGGFRQLMAAWRAAKAVAHRQKRMKKKRTETS